MPAPTQDSRRDRALQAWQTQLPPDNTRRIAGLCLATVGTFFVGLVMALGMFGWLP